MTLYLVSTTERCQSAASTDISSAQHPNAAGCMQMCISINYQHDRRNRWWTGNNEFQQTEPAMHTLWPLFKHVLIVSPYLQLCKHILTLDSTLCDWNLGRIPVLENGRRRSHKRKSSNLPAGGEVTQRWMGYQELIKPSLHGWGEKRKQKSVNWRIKKQITPCWGGWGAQRSGFSCVLYFTISLQVKRWQEALQFPDSSAWAPSISWWWDEVSPFLLTSEWRSLLEACFPSQESISLMCEWHVQMHIRKAAAMLDSCSSVSGHWSQHVDLKLRRGPYLNCICI